jgi:hypothetical protein
MWDNYLLGATYQLAGKGVLSRWVAHEVMLQLYGPTAEATAAQRVSWWINNIAFIISPAIVGFSVIGTFQMVRKKMVNELTILMPWVILITGFTILTDFEARALMPAIPAYILLAVYGLGETMVWLRRRLYTLGNEALAGMEALLMVLVTLSNNILFVELQLPTKPAAFAGIDLLVRSIFGTTGWLSDYLVQLTGKTHPPSLLIDPAYIAEAFVCLFFTVGFLALTVNKGKLVESKKVSVLEKRPRLSVSTSTSEPRAEKGKKRTRETISEIWHRVMDS